MVASWTFTFAYSEGLCRRQLMVYCQTITSANKRVIREILSSFPKSRSPLFRNHPFTLEIRYPPLFRFSARLSSAKPTPPYLRLLTLLHTQFLHTIFA